MENKYFTPDIEDIHVGYECESHEWSMDEIGIPELNYDRWVKKVLDKNYVKTLVEYGINGIRVPYLTKEQVEAEGWSYVNKSFHTVKMGFGKGNYVACFLNNGKLNITMLDVLLDDYTEQTSNGRLYLGECKDINTFRYICKLLNIN